MSTQPLQKTFMTVGGQRMAYHERGQGKAIVFLHGNPTSSYLCRAVIPYLEPIGRCIAPDLVGHGDSDKVPGDSPDRYSFAQQSKYLGLLLEALDVGNDVILVVQDWGSALGFDWANHHRDRVRGLVYMEAITAPMTWDEAPNAPFFKRLRSPEGEHRVLQENTFLTDLLPSFFLRKLSPAEVVEYRRPFTEPGEGRRPMLSWARQIPIEGEPADVHLIVSDYSSWLSQSQVPKLFINADRGVLTVGRLREVCRAWPNQTEVTVPGSHCIQEDSADAIGSAIVDWLRGLS